MITSYIFKVDQSINGLNSYLTPKIISTFKETRRSKTKKMMTQNRDKSTLFHINLVKITELLQKEVQRKKGDDKKVGQAISIISWLDE